MNGLVLCLDTANAKSYGDNTENLLLYSEDFSNAYWTKSNVSVTSNAITSPTGSSNASKLVESASTAVHELSRGSDAALAVGTDTYITFSIFVKAAERQYCYIRSSGNSKRIAVVVDLSNGTFNVTNWSGTSNSSATVTAYPNGWYRITATSQSNYTIAPGWAGNFFVSPSDSYQLASDVGGGGYSYAGNGTSGIYIWGAHYEFGPGISNYYATTGTAKTRGTIWTDLSGRGNTGTLTNGPTYSSANSGSIVFDGSNDYAPIGTSAFPFGSSPGTLSGWVKTNTISGSWGWIISYGSYTNSQARFIGINNSTYYFGGIADDITASGVPLNTWFNMVGVYDGTNASMYVNGSLVSGPTAKTWNTVANNSQIGRQVNSTEYWNGNIAQVSIYNRALSAVEISQNFNALRGRYGI